jgi:Protein of unknown function (DUF3467)
MSEAKTDLTSAPATSNGHAQTRDTQLAWDDTRMTTHFANVVNIQSTREQVDLFFGTNQTWNLAGDRPLSIELSNRIILSPYAAKRLSSALNGVLREYEQRYGALEV